MSLSSVANAKASRCCLIVLNCNGKELLRACLDSIRKQSYTDFETIVVDNGSVDGSVQMVAKEYEWVRTIALPENCGFSIANNVAMRDALARGIDFAMLLNNDTIADPDCMAKLVAAIEADEGIAVVCPKIYFADHRETLWYAGADFSLWTARLWLRGWKQKDQGQWDRLPEVTVATGCALLARSSALREAGLLDEHFWAYLEDVECPCASERAVASLRAGGACLAL